MSRHQQTRSTLFISLPKPKTKGNKDTMKQNKDKKRFKTQSIKHWSSSLNPIHRDPLQKLPSSSAYIIESDFHDNILTISVYHTINKKKWRQQFTQNSFTSLKIYTIAKTLIKSIESTAVVKYNADDEKETIDFRPLQIKIFEHNEFCYVTLLDSKFPSFALRPIPSNASSSSKLQMRHFKPRTDEPFVRNKWNPKEDDLSAGVHSIEGMSSENTMSTWTQTLSDSFYNTKYTEPGNSDSLYNKYKTMENHTQSNVQYGFV